MGITVRRGVGGSWRAEEDEGEVWEEGDEGEEGEVCAEEAEEEWILEVKYSSSWFARWVLPEEG